MPPSPINRRRSTDSEFDPSAEAAAPTPAPKLSHRLFSHNNKKRKASSRTAEVVVQAAPLPRRKKQAVTPPPSTTATVEEGPGISILEGITRGSIANMVLARLGKLNPNELIGAAPSQPVRADQFQEDDEDGDESTDHRDGGGKPKEDDGEPSGSTKDDEVMVQAHDDDDEEEPEPVEKEHIKFRDAVKPQPLSEDPPNQEMEGIYLVKSGPYMGSRGTLHRIAAHEYFILQTDDGSVATVHESQVSKTSSSLPSSHSYNRVKLTNDDKKNFVEDVKWYLTGGVGYFREEEVATRGMEAANALKIAMNTLDPRKDVFRFRRGSKTANLGNNNSGRTATDAARQPQRSP